jgi:hypothetical protein
MPTALIEPSASAIGYEKPMWVSQMERQYLGSKEIFGAFFWA